jgi:16S rRNA (cytidine1402-2'-O)-methyltransferase
LVLVGTPIGNLADLSPRAIEVLTGADRILCEDTRRTRTLLSAFDIPAGGRLSPLHDHNEQHRSAEIAGAVTSGETVVLVSDAGMPGISDPGQLIVAAVIEAGGSVTVVPGPSAVLSALVLSGFATDRFCMEGFLPRKGRERRAALDLLAAEPRTTVIFESPRRLGATMAEFSEKLGAARRVMVARELTKLFEELWRGTLEEAAEHYRDHEVKGEVVIVLEGAIPAEVVAASDDVVREHLRASLGRGLSRRDATDLASAELGVSRRHAYDLATTL